MVERVSSTKGRIAAAATRQDAGSSQRQSKERVQGDQTYKERGELSTMALLHRNRTMPSLSGPPRRAFFLRISCSARPPHHLLPPSPPPPPMRMTLERDRRRGGAKAQSRQPAQ
ncbi:hypothetical protein BDZ90DRAFT_26509 [Jaminaea rosea]|uniref:Uncharacterized protein n=1 Tax=Jaminaea rosea TaxID=1569628 RepID=A0A316UZZ5_9BASI|nr:hypothetical protein BDZ90DRAFT_26509 [Jaminaea rosea]PWN30877.1 hypothetical protein BDZ90DRAFT_26509 [Jaminaea rosea]